jgi:hypothetical protein
MGDPDIDSEIADIAGQIKSTAIVGFQPVNFLNSPTSGILSRNGEDLDEGFF